MLCLQLRGDIELAQGQNKPLPSWQMICRRRCRLGGPAVPLTHFVRMVCCWLNIINLKARGKRAKGEGWERGESEEDPSWEGKGGIRFSRRPHVHARPQAHHLAEGCGFSAPPNALPEALVGAGVLWDGEGDLGSAWLVRRAEGGWQGPPHLCKAIV